MREGGLLSKGKGKFKVEWKTGLEKDGARSGGGIQKGMGGGV